MTIKETDGQIQLGNNTVTPNKNITLTNDPATGDLVFNKGSVEALTEIQRIRNDGSGISYMPAGTGATPTTVQSKLRESVSVKDFGAVGDGVTDDTAAIQTALSLGKIVYGVSGETYRVTSGLTATVSGSILDLNGSSLLADFTTGWAFSAGDGVAVTSNVGIRNGTVYTADVSTALNGVRWRNSVRRQVAYENLRIRSFKGIGGKFEELNWSIQGAFAPLIEACGVNLWLDNNANAVTLAGMHLYDADTYNLVLRGTYTPNVIGGANQGANTAGIYIDNGLVGATQASFQTNISGVYFENNGVNHIVASNGRGLNVTGNFVNGDLMTGPAVKLINWLGADIKSNTVVNMTAGTTRDFVEADASCLMIAVGKQHVTAAVDAAVCVNGGSKLGIVEAYGSTTATLPTATPTNQGSVVLFAPATGTGSARNRPYMCMTVGTAARSFVGIATRQRKMSAAAVATPYTPVLTSTETFDATVPTGGLTINAPTGAYDDGDRITFILKQNSTGGSALTWDAAYKTNFSNTGNVANAYGSVEFIWSAGRSLWVQVASMPWTV